MSATIRLGPRFQQRAARLADTPWLLATSEDFRVPETEGGPRPPALPAVHGYLDRVFRAARHRPGVRRSFNRALHLLDPYALFYPAAVAEVLLHGGRATAAARSVPVPTSTPQATGQTEPETRR